jgi:hypothetical protein
MSIFRDLERRIDDRLRRLFQSEPSPGQGRELVEIQRMVLDQIEARVQMLPRARRAFPFNDIAVRIPAADADRKIAIESVFATDDALKTEITQHLERENIEYPPDLRVTVTAIETAEVMEPSVVCRKIEEPPVAAPAESATVQFTLPDGGTLELTKGRIHIGRMSDVHDDKRRLVRRNDVVIEHSTVSRAHAHIEFNNGEHRLFDDGSSYGTSAIHEGRLVEVPRAGGRGLRLHSGDEIYFGQVRVSFRTH